MPYGTIKVDTITFTAGGVDTSVSISGLVQNPTFTGNITSTGTISGNIIRGGATVSGATVTGTAGQFGTLTGNTAGFTTVTGTTVTGTTANFTTLSGTTATITSGVFASGTAAAPSVSVGTTTNGLFSSGANEVAISTGGSGRLFVDSTGNVGIGASPAFVFDAYKASAGTVGRLRSNGTDANLSIRNSAREGIVGSDNTQSYLLNTDAYPWTIWTNNQERLRITSAGLVGIGTSSPATALDVVGEINATTGFASNRFGVNKTPLSTTTTAQSFAWFKTTGGDFYIGTESSTAGGFFAGSTAYAACLYNNAATPIQFFTGGAVRATLNSTGLGIGTATPQVDFVVSNGGASGVEIDAGYISGNSLIQAYNRSGAAFDTLALRAADFSFQVGGATERARIDSSGRLLVGTSSTSSISNTVLQGRSNSSTGGALLTIARGSNNPANNEELGLIYFADSGHTGAAIIEARRDGGTWTSGTSQPTRLTFSTTADGAASPTERMRIHSTGNTSIGGGALFGGLTDPGSSVKILSTVIGSGAGTHFIKWSNVTGNLSYDTSSRLIKEDIIDCPYGIAEVKQLKPRKYFRTDDQANEIGFIADEVVDLMPEFVPVGPKSVITRNDEDTEEIPLGVNYDKLTAVLTKALQEAIAKIETLEAKVAALESA